MSMQKITHKTVKVTSQIIDALKVYQGTHCKKDRTGIVLWGLIACTVATEVHLPLRSCRNT